jgi:hypothetical protein
VNKADDELVEQLLGISPLNTKPVSSACAGQMHACCTDWDLCGCLVCHKICGACGQNCRSVYELPGGLEVCSSCYRTMAPPVGRTTACEECGHPSSYRHPGKGDDRFLCPSCHVAAGHFRRQDRHED